MTARSTHQTLLLAAAALALAGCNESAPMKAPPPATKTTAAAASKPANPAPPPAAAPAAAAATPELEAGKKLFMTACANCHGPDGTGSMMRQMMPKIGDLTNPETTAKLDDAAFRKLISEGRDKMPAFGTVFKPEQIDQIIAYARSLAKK